MTYLEDGLLVFGKRVPTDELHDFSQLVFVLEDLADGFTEAHELGVDLGVVLAKDSIVVGEGDVPVHGGEVLALGQLLVQAPENLHDSKRGGRDGVREVTTGGRHGTDDRDRALTVGRAEAGDSASAFVELSQLGAQVGGETSIGGHLGETTRDFSEGLGPAGGGVSHHSDVEAHISEVFGQGDARVNGGFTSGDWHVGGVGDQARALHDIILLTVDQGLELREFVKHLSHLVTALTTADVDDAIGVGVLGESLRDASLAATEGAWNGASTALHGGEKGVEHALAGQQGGLTSELLGDGSGVTDGPEVGHLDLLLLAVGVLNDCDSLGHVVLALGHDFNESALHSGGDHDSVLAEEVVLEGLADHIAASDDVSTLEELGGLEGVEAVLVE